MNLSHKQRRILDILDGKELSGLQIHNELTHWKNAAWLAVTAPGIYPTLHSLEDLDLIESRWGEPREDRDGLRRRYYRLTQRGARMRSGEAGVDFIGGVA